MDLKDNSIYLEVTEDNVKTFKPEDTVALTERASTYYTTAFNKAKNDTEHKDFIYFERSLQHESSRRILVEQKGL